jgi:predicted transcriptional regulator
MVAESYSQARRDMAKKIGLGQKGRAANGSGGRSRAKTQS